jgi:ribosomal protein S3
LEDLIKRKVAPIKVIEIKNPDLNAQLVGRGDCRAAQEARQLPSRAQAAHGSVDAGRRQGNSP